MCRTVHLQISLMALHCVVCFTYRVFFFIEMFMTLVCVGALTLQAL
jgi:hypothetical protein